MKILITGGAGFLGSHICDRLLDDGHNKKIVTLNRPDYGLMILPGIWRELFEFSSGAICLVLASRKYDEDDYMRNYDQFVVYRDSLNSTPLYRTDNKP